jgi:hypothetical protein
MVINHHSLCPTSAAAFRYSFEIFFLFLLSTLIAINSDVVTLAHCRDLHFADFKRDSFAAVAAFCRHKQLSIHRHRLRLLCRAQSALFWCSICNVACTFHTYLYIQWDHHKKNFFNSSPTIFLLLFRTTEITWWSNVLLHYCAFQYQLLMLMRIMQIWLLSIDWGDIENVSVHWLALTLLAAGRCAFDSLWKGQV